MSHLSCVNQASKTLKVVQQYITTGMETTLDVAMDVLEHSQGKAGDRVLDLKDIMLQYAQMDRDIQQFKAATEHVLQSKDQDEDDLEKMLQHKLTQLQQHNSNNDLMQHEKYTELLEKINSFDSGAGSGDAGSEDVALTQQEVNTRCPYTGQEMTDPVKNPSCGHSYDRKGIQELIKNGRGRAKCPVPGCVNEKPIMLADLQENRELKRYIDRLHRQASKRT